MPTAQSAKQKRKRCQNCNHLFVPARNVPDQKFCKDACRRQFWTHGSAFGPMKAGLYSAIDKKYAALAKEIGQRLKRLETQIENVSLEWPKQFKRDLAMSQELVALRQRIESLEKVGGELRAEFERHTHDFYTDGAAGDISTLSPTEVRERDNERFRRERDARMSSARKQPRG